MRRRLVPTKAAFLGKSRRRSKASRPPGLPSAGPLTAAAPASFTARSPRRHGPAGLKQETRHSNMRLPSPRRKSLRDPSPAADGRPRKGPRSARPCRAVAVRGASLTLSQLHGSCRSWGTATRGPSLASAAHPPHRARASRRRTRGRTRKIQRRLRRSVPPFSPSKEVVRARKDWRVERLCRSHAFGCGIFPSPTVQCRLHRQHCSTDCIACSVVPNT